MDKESDFSNITPNQWIDKCVSDWLIGRQGPNTFNPYPSRKPSNGGKCVSQILDRTPSNTSDVFWAISDCRRQLKPGSEKQKSELSDCEKQGNKCGEGQSCKPFLRMIGTRQVGRNKINNRCSQLNNFYTVSSDGICTDVKIITLLKKTEEDCNKISGLTWRKPCNGTLCVKYSDVDDSTAKSECEANKPSPGFNFDPNIVGKFDSNDGLCNFFEKEGSVCQDNTRENTCTYYDSTPWHLNPVQVCRAKTGACEDPYSLDTYTNDPEHGDVCRKKDGSGEWKAPKGCVGIGEAPWTLTLSQSPGDENIGSTQIKTTKKSGGNRNWRYDLHRKRKYYKIC